MPEDAPLDDLRQVLAVSPGKHIHHIAHPRQMPRHLGHVYILPAAVYAARANLNPQLRFCVRCRPDGINKADRLTNLTREELNQVLLWWQQVACGRGDDAG